MSPRDRIGDLAGARIEPNVQHDSRAMDVRRLGFLGARRQELEEALALNRELIVDELERVDRVTGRPRLRLAADLVSIHRDTLRAALRARKEERVSV